MNKFFFTCGDPNGIGPEIVIKTLNKVYNSSSEFYFLCPQNIFLRNTSLAKPKFKYKFYKNIAESNLPANHIKIVDISGGKLSIGKPTKTSGKISFNSLKNAIYFVKKMENAALITAPISKLAWKLNKIKFDGHTDYLGNYFNVSNPLMLFHSNKIIAALATIHHPIEKVPALITKERLVSITNSLITSLQKDFGVCDPQIAVLGLNPHAGENGVLGTEEIKVIIPMIEKYKSNLLGPYVPDAFFGQHLYKNFDAVLGMYHDQVLVPFKMLAFYTGVNYTANLPIIRTSPDHGTAFNIAYKGIANPKSMIEAYKLAKVVLKNRRKQ